MRCKFRLTGDTGDKRGPRYDCVRWGCDQHAFTRLRDPVIVARCHGWLARQPGPGDVLRVLIRVATAGQAEHGLECELYRSELNSLGWTGCWRARAEIVSRMREEAKRGGFSASWNHVAWNALTWATSSVVRELRRALSATRQ